MVTPSDANAPEPSDQEEEIIESGFDLLLFWDQNRQAILLAAGVILLGLVGFGIYQYNQTQRLTAAAAALAHASTEADYRQITEKYSGTVAAGNASLHLAAKLREDRKYDEAISVLQNFLEKYPKHPLVAAADLSIGETLDAEKKTDEAIAKYEEVAAKYPESYSAPLAVIAQANILKGQGKTEEVRRVYENFVAQFPDSVFSQEVMTEMRLLRSAPKASPTPAPSTTLEGTPMLPLAPAAAPSAAPPVAMPGASAPVAPVMPGASPK